MQAGLNRNIMYSNDIKKLMKLYSQLNQISKYRREYREQGFRHEYWDEGHTNMISWLEEDMVQVEERLSEIFNQDLHEQAENRSMIVGSIEKDREEFHILKKGRRQVLIEEINNTPVKEEWDYLPCLTRQREKEMIIRTKLIELSRKFISDKYRAITQTTIDPFEFCDFVLVLICRIDQFVRKLNIRRKSPIHYGCLMCYGNDLEESMFRNKLCCVKNIYSLFLRFNDALYTFACEIYKNYPVQRYPHLFLKFEVSGDKVELFAAIFNDKFLEPTFVFSRENVSKLREHYDHIEDDCELCLEELRKGLPYRSLGDHAIKSV